MYIQSFVMVNIFMRFLGVVLWVVVVVGINGFRGIRYLHLQG
jgi:hypothetical protein